jgi:hypothetical protein
VWVPDSHVNPGPQGCVCTAATRGPGWYSRRQQQSCSSRSCSTQLTLHQLLLALLVVLFRSLARMLSSRSHPRTMQQQQLVVMVAVTLVLQQCSS